MAQNQNEFYYDGVSFTAKDYVDMVIMETAKEILDKFFYLMKSSAKAGDRTAVSFLVCDRDVPTPIKKVIKEHLIRCGYKFVSDSLNGALAVENPIQNDT